MTKLLAFWWVAAGWFSTYAQDQTELTRVTREIPERGQVEGAAIRSGKVRDSFIVPAGWRLGLSKAEGKVILQSRDYQGTIEIQSMPTNENRPTPGQMREQAGAAVEGWRLEREFVWPGTNAPTLAFDAVNVNNAQLELRRRTLFILRDDRVTRVVLMASPERFESCQRAFEIVVASLRSE